MANPVGPITLAVAHIDAAERFYNQAIGLSTLSSSSTTVTLGLDGAPFITLLSDSKSKQHPRAPGLFHIAILLPSRPALAAQLRHLAEIGVRLHGASDHLVSEALYLSDPEGNGLELYCDRPKSDWSYRDGELVMAPEPLDLNSLLAAAPHEPWRGIAPETKLGHIHLQVSDVPRAVSFYRDLLGFDLTTTYGASAAFLSFSGYHHHLAVNCWNSRGAAPVESLGLRQFVIRVADLAAVRSALKAHTALFHAHDDALELTDPSGNRIRVESYAQVSS